MVNMGELFAYGVISDQDMNRVSMSENEMGRFGLADGDLLFGRRSLVESGAGKCSLVSGLLEPTTFESSLIRVRLNDKVDPRFYYYWFQSHEGRGRIKAIVTGTNVKGIRASVLSSIRIIQPSLTIQTRIADILSAYDELIENNHQRIWLLEQAARLLYREWFVYLRFPGHEHVKIMDGVPEGWECKKFDDVCITVGGGTPSTSNREYWDDGDIPWVIPSDVTKNGSLALIETQKKITQAGLKASSAKMVPPEAILMTSRASVGYFAVMECAVCTNQGFINIIPCHAHHSMYMLHNLMYRVDELRAHASGSTYPEISKKRFRDLEVLIPSDILLRSFNEFAYTNLKQARALTKQNMNLAKARDLLLLRLMKGEIAV
jgi:type I restriction enzyme S subunit